MQQMQLLNRPISSVKLETTDPVVASTSVGILPVEFVQSASRAARLWCFARSLDHPDNGGQGSGLISFDLCDLIVGLNRSGRSCYRYLKAALAQGFIYWYRVNNEKITLKYKSLEKVARLLELKTIGPVVSFPLDQLEHAKAIAAEGMAESLQAQSYFKMKVQWGRFAKGQPKAAEILTGSASEKSAGVLVARGRRLAYFAPHWRPFGGSQRTIADRLGVSTRTIQNRLSHSWRHERGMNPLDKAQAAHQVYEDYDPLLWRELYKYTPNANERWIKFGRRLFERKTNLYATQCELRPQRRRKAVYKEAIAASTDKPELSPKTTGTPEIGGNLTLVQIISIGVSEV